MKKILEKIKEYSTIIIHGHIRPDGDSIGSQYGLMYLINDNFPEKKVYVTGDVSEYVSFLGRPEMVDDNLFKDALSICVDCPRYDRLSDNRCNLAKFSIKIDHHSDSESYTDYEFVNPTSASCTEIITEFYMMFKDELKLSKNAATALYVGLLTDTGYFSHSNVSEKTFIMASELVSRGVDILDVNNKLSLKTEEDLRLKGYCLNNFKITENGFVYIKLTKEEVESYGVKDENAASLVTSISTIKEAPVWALFIESNDDIRIRLRSRGPAINHLAKKYNGGGHIFASGGRLNNWDELDSFIKEADMLVKEYKISEN